MEHLGYCSTNYLHMMGPTGEREELVCCPSTILNEVTRILLNRWPHSLTLARRERELSSPVHSLERRQLLERVAQLEEEFFEWAIKSLM